MRIKAMVLESPVNITLAFKCCHVSSALLYYILYILGCSGEAETERYRCIVSHSAAPHLFLVTLSNTDMWCDVIACIACCCKEKRRAAYFSTVATTSRISS
uniref:Uncharacterized protein n=1 Tax=Sphaerodactylus townsendi TaxID=933632 RepID=A0ACB8EN63_9SAUR